MKKIIPVNKKVLLQPIIEEKVGRIIIPDTSKTKRGFATILEMSDDSEVKSLKKGDKVIYPLFEGSTVSLESVDYILLDEVSILGIIKEV